MNKLSVTTAGILAGSAAVFLLGLALERAKAPGRPPLPAGNEPVTGEKAVDADDAKRSAWPFPTSDGQKLP